MGHPQTESFPRRRTAQVGAQKGVSRPVLHPRNPYTQWQQGMSIPSPNTWKHQSQQPDLVIFKTILFMKICCTMHYTQFFTLPHTQTLIAQPRKLPLPYDRCVVRDDACQRPSPPVCTVINTRERMDRSHWMKKAGGTPQHPLARWVQSCRLWGGGQGGGWGGVGSVLGTVCRDEKPAVWARGDGSTLWAPPRATRPAPAFPIPHPTQSPPGSCLTLPGCFWGGLSPRCAPSLAPHDHCTHDA